MDFSIVWNLADILMGCMALINLPVIFRLLKPVRLALNDYQMQRERGIDPVFRASNIGFTQQTEFWN